MMSISTPILIHCIDGALFRPDRGDIRCTTFARKPIGKANYKKNTFRSTNKNDREIAVCTQEDRLVWEAGIQALRRKEGSRVVGLELGLGLGLVSGLRVKLRARVRVWVGVNDVAAVVEFLVLVLLVHGVTSCIVSVVYKHYSIQRLDDDMALS